MKTHVSTPELTYRYPSAGDEKPPGGAKVLLLTRGGICVTGPWSDDGRYMGWAPMPKRVPEKEPSRAAVEAKKEIWYRVERVVNPDSGRERWGVRCSDGVLHFPQRTERTAAVRLMNKLALEAQTTIRGDS